MMGNLSGPSSSATPVSGLPQTMVDVMQGVLSGNSSTFSGVMQGMLDAMDDLLVSPSAATSTGTATFQAMADAMHTVLTETASGSASAASLVQTMTSAMHNVISGGSSGILADVIGMGLGMMTGTAQNAPPSGVSLMLSADGHVLAATVDRAHLGISANASGFMVTQAATGQAAQMISGLGTIMATDGQIATGLDTTYADTAYGLYQAALGGRPANAEGLQYWANAIKQGMPLQAVAESFMQASTALSGQMTDTQFLDQMYHNLIGQSGAADGMAYWANAMTHGLSRDVVLLSFANAADSMATAAGHAGATGYWLL